MDNILLENIPFEGATDDEGRRYVFICDMKTGISRWSPGAVEYFGLPGEYMKNAGKIWSDHVHPDDRDLYLDDINQVFSGKKNEHWIDYRARNKDGDYVVCTCKGKIVKASDGISNVFAGYIENNGISQYIDSVTGFYNVYAFLKDIEGLANNPDNEISLFAVAINHFADINNMYGYTQANKIIKAFCDNLRSVAGYGNRIYRMDGVKFCIAMKNTDLDVIEEKYSKLQKVGQKGFEFDQIHSTFTLSGGVVALDSDVSEFSVQAGISYVLDQSKYKKHGELVYFGDDVVEKKRKDLEKIDALRHCVYNGMEGFYLCYQPIVCAKTEKICGMETLLRWNRQPFGEIPPGMFVPWLENDPCFFKLGQWIMKKALTDTLDIIKEHPDYIVNVNVSVEQIERSAFRQSVKQILKETGFPPENFCMELTERVMSLDVKYLRQELDYFRAMGIKIALDDFGTGVSSLSLLLDLSVDCLKIDRNFILDITTSEQEQLMVSTIATCAEGLGLEICVEGVETKEMKDFLKKYNIQKHQGYLYSKPIVLEKFIELVEKEG